jgi:HEAT repeat protein
MKRLDITSFRSLALMLAGDPIQAMESAKKIIGGKVNIDPALLAEIASNKTYKKWSRIAAIYALGFVNYTPSAQELIRILGSRDEDSRLKDHAAEALGNMNEPRATAILARILRAKEKPHVKQSCIYALSQIGGSRAHSALKKFEATKPAGKIGMTLKQALIKLNSR